MKFLLPVLGFAALSSAQSFDDVKKCIYDKCPDQSAKCNGTCEQKLENCADKCGLKVNQVCWGGCVGVFGPATNVALCAANKGCLEASTEQEQNDEISFEQIGKFIDQYLRNNE